MSLKEEERLRQAALKADDEFTSQLERVYGSKAGNARYQWRHEDPLVEAAMWRKLAGRQGVVGGGCGGRAMTATLALTSLPPLSEDTADATCLTEAERAMVEVVGLYGDEGWEAVALHFPLSWRTFEPVPPARASFEALRAKGLVVTRDGRIELTADGRWIAGMLG